MKKEKKMHNPGKNNFQAEKKYLGTANWLTIIRMLLMIPFVILMTIAFLFISKYNGTFWYDKIKLVGQQQYPVALSAIYWINVIIFLAAMITDFVDGHIARKTKTISQFGKIFDPIADKIATSLMLLFIALMNYSFLPIVVLFIVRDILVEGARIYAVKKDIKVASNWWGKTKTIVVSLALIVVAFAGPWMVKLDEKGNYTPDYLKLFFINIPLILGSIFSWITAIIYLAKYLKGITKDYSEEIKNQNDNQKKEINQVQEIKEQNKEENNSTEINQNEQNK
ncbi:CDP-diacylglycerol-glycerol-3-phosphate3-phosphatidyltransferase [Metamycoplasma alkalescens 14918]|uniref:CDP-diacylglycerol--glycerol-3-phosphate 3-phosphatidyltransferase n=1 Tax=Metamycoplasma alkalescens 14918 TaxID=1188234 RepID=N9SRY0_9BACT|nr:CDP-diacylglycerol--glycerol-3-phosphate 3-phosphatidyltransferase [Metamycoplasma alkalescens]ENY54134.1 CDP-diacylglycerol-glycerol-3-phosphate3-phosphatidyltransferase [Metamycoplasma alkalescens 14918]